MRWEKIKKLNIFIHKSLNSTIENIIENFLPQSKCKYQKKNFRLMIHYKKISNFIPIFLHERPETFVKHIYDCFATAQNISI